MNYINDVWQYIHPFINWVVFVLVIASGYFIRASKILPRIDKTLKILIVSTVVTAIYGIAIGINLGMYIASYFLAIGFHAAFLKILEKVYKNFILSRIGGELPKNDDEKKDE